MDFPKQIRVNVTQEDIDSGHKNSCSRCPVALAVGRIFPNNEMMDVVECIRVGYKGSYTEYAITKQTNRFINDFDNGEKVSPFKFRARLL